MLYFFKHDTFNKEERLHEFVFRLLSYPLSQILRTGLHGLMSIFVRVHVCFKDEGDGDGKDDDYDNGEDDDGDGEIMIIMMVMMGMVAWSGCQGDSSKIVVGHTCK